MAKVNQKGDAQTELKLESQSSFMELPAQDNVEMEDQTVFQQDESDEDEISASFFGKLTSILKWQDNGVQNERTNFDKFQNVLLNVQNEKDIYAAWEKEHRGAVENFQHAPGETPVTAEKVDWIENLPEVMIL